MTSLMRGPLRAGAAKVDITPQDLTGLTNLWQLPFEGVHDSIYLILQRKVRGQNG